MHTLSPNQHINGTASKSCLTTACTAWLGVWVALVCNIANAQTGIPAHPAIPEPWPVRIMLPAAMTAGWKPVKGATNGDVCVWTAPGASHIRAMLLVPNNTDSKNFAEYDGLRAVAVKRELGLVYLRRFDAQVFEFTDPPADAGALQAVLDLVAERTGIREFRVAPWITFGKSSRGRFPYRLAWLYPERTIACLTYHGETPVWPLPGWARPQDQSVLHLSINGELEWMGTWYRHVRPSLLNYRANTAWLPHQVVVRGVGHGNYVDGHGSPGWGKPVASNAVSVLRVWDYMALFIDKACALRVPTDRYPATATVALKPVDPATGYLLHPRAPEALSGARWRPLRETNGVFTIVDHIREPHEVYDESPATLERGLLIREASDVPPSKRRRCFWVADKELADAWVALHKPPGESATP